MIRRIAVLAVGLALVIPGAALARSSTCQAYHRQLCSILSQRNTSSGTPSDATSSDAANSDAASDSASRTSQAGTLPFTGLDVVLVVVGGAVLLGSGLVVRRLSRRLD